MRSQWVSDDILNHVLVALMPQNRLACEVSHATGLRIGDVLALKSELLQKSDGRFTVKEEKTGKTRRVRLSADLLDRCIKMSGRYYVFEHRTNPKQHKTRQAIFKDLRRACKAFRIAQQVSPHSLRKMYAVAQFKRTGSVAKVSQLLNHSSEAVTMIYAMADCLKNKRLDKPFHSR